MGFGEMGKALRDYIRWRREDPWGFLAMERKRSRHMILIWFLVSAPLALLTVIYSGLFLILLFSMLIILLLGVSKDHVSNFKR